MSVIDLTHLDAVALPTTDAEIWRYSRIGELDLDSFTPGRADTTVTGDVTNDAPRREHDPDAASDLLDRLPERKNMFIPVVAAQRLDESAALLR